MQNVSMSILLIKMSFQHKYQAPHLNNYPVGILHFYVAY